MEKTNGQIRIGFYICHCGTNIASTVDVQKVTDFAASLPNVVVAKNYKYMCSDPGQDIIINDIKEQNLNRVVVAACSPFLHERTFRNATHQGGLNQFYFQMVNTREQNAWVHLDPLASTEKAIDLVRAAIQRVASHKPLEQKKVPIHPDVLVIGGGIAGIHASLTLANAGKKVYLVEREPTIGGHMAMFDKTFPTLDCAACILTPKMVEVGQHNYIKLMTYSKVQEVSGVPGNYTVKILKKARKINLETCIGCGTCAEKCPVKVPSEFDANTTLRRAA